MRTARFPRNDRGVTLIELMISIVIGLVVVAAVMVNFVSTGKAGRYQFALGQMNQDAQVALNMLSREVQLAGYASPSNSIGNNTSPLFGCDATKSSTAGAIPFVSETVAAQPTCSASTTSPTVSALEVVYEADIFNTVPASGVPSDCTGGAAPLSGTIRVTRNRYFVDRAAAGGRPELYCASSGSAKIPIVENVEDMQIWYGSFTAARESEVARYAKAAAVNAQTSGEWNNIIAVRICLLMRSAEPVLSGDDSQKYLGCDSEVPIAYTDRFLRRAYFTTATVRSKMAP